MKLACGQTRFNSGDGGPLKGVAIRPPKNSTNLETHWSVISLRENIQRKQTNVRVCVCVCVVAYFISGNCVLKYVSFLFLFFSFFVEM